MTITSAQAVAVARKYGLPLSDAAALVRLSTTVEEAEDFAGQIATPGQLSRDDLKTMSPEQIEAARVGNRLTDVLSGKAGPE